LKKLTKIGESIKDNIIRDAVQTADDLLQKAEAIVGKHLVIKPTSKSDRLHDIDQSINSVTGVEKANEQNMIILKVNGRLNSWRFSISSADYDKLAGGGEVKIGNHSIKLG
jgi:hypothetical protein